jgi:hypothetical protein
VDVILNPQKITRIFVYIAALLFTANAIAQALILVVGDEFFYGFVPLFHFNQEKNAPTYFSSFSLAFIAVLVAVIASAHRGKRYFWHWAAMAVIFLVASFDELVAIHEQMTQPLRNAFQLSGLLYYAWVIPVAIVLVVLAFLYARFMWDLPTKTRTLFIISGAVFVSGAMVFEMLGGAIFDEMGTGVRHLPYIILMTLEETFEMGGTILFIYATLRYIQEHLPGLRVMVAMPEVTEPVETASEPLDVKNDPVPAQDRPTTRA